MELDEPTLSPRERATRFADTSATSSRKLLFIASSRPTTSSSARHSSSSRPQMSSRTRRLRSINSGRPTSPISRSSVGAGSISQPFSTTSRVTFLQGDCLPLALQSRLSVRLGASGRIGIDCHNGVSLNGNSLHWSQWEVGDRRTALTGGASAA